jgi:DNA-binding transcriptional ArsR family regulator
MAVVPDTLLEEVARLFSLLSDPTRLRLLSTLHEHGELVVGEVAARTGISLPNASQHLTRLAAAGVVARRREGRTVVYRIADERIEQLCDIVCAGVRERAALLAG